MLKIQASSCALGMVITAYLHQDKTSLKSIGLLQHNEVGGSYCSNIWSQATTKVEDRGCRWRSSPSGPRARTRIVNDSTFDYKSPSARNRTRLLCSILLIAPTARPPGVALRIRSSVLSRLRSDTNTARVCDPKILLKGAAVHFLLASSADLLLLHSLTSRKACLALSSPRSSSSSSSPSTALSMKFEKDSKSSTAVMVSMTKLPKPAFRANRQTKGGENAHEMKPYVYEVDRGGIAPPWPSTCASKSGVRCTEKKHRGESSS